MLGLRTGYNRKQREDKSPTLSKFFWFGFLNALKQPLLSRLADAEASKLDLWNGHRLFLKIPSKTKVKSLHPHSGIIECETWVSREWTTATTRNDGWIDVAVNLRSRQCHVVKV